MEHPGQKGAAIPVDLPPVRGQVGEPEPVALLCGYTLEELFARAEPSVLELVRTYISMLRSLGDVQVISQKTRLCLRCEGPLRWPVSTQERVSCQFPRIGGWTARGLSRRQTMDRDGAVTTSSCSRKPT